MGPGDDAPIVGGESAQSHPTRDDSYTHLNAMNPKDEAMSTENVCHKLSLIQVFTNYSSHPPLLTPPAPPPSGLGCEVAKNVILAGVDKMTICDDENVSKTDFDSAFFLPRDSVGKNRAESAVVVRAKFPFNWSRSWDRR